jgi:RNA polymerase sigma-70 factor (ECF subfamily)
MALADSDLPRGRDPIHDRDQDRLWLQLVAHGGREGDQAVASLFRRYRRPLLGFLAQRGLGAEAAEDLVQDVFIRMVKGAAGFRHEARVSSWLFQIAANLHVDQTRRVNLEDTADEAQWQHIEGTVAAQGALDAPVHTAAQDLHDCFEQGFAQFARAHPARAEALQQVVVHNWAVRDVAAFLERSEGATREFLSQCRKKLREFLEPCRGFLGEG